MCSQLGKKQKQADEDKKSPAPSAVCDEASTSGFTEIPLSLPPCPPEATEELQNPVKTTGTAAQASETPSEKEETYSAQTQNTSELTETLQSGLNLSAERPQVTVQRKESNKGEKEDDGVVAQVPEPKAALQTNNLEKDVQLWNQPFVTAQFGNPSAPSLYPSVPALEEDSMMQIYEKAAKNCAREPAVLALPEQESSPLSLQPLKSVAELPRSKLYPELPKTAPEMQVITFIPLLAQKSIFGRNIKCSC